MIAGSRVLLLPEGVDSTDPCFQLPLRPRSEIVYPISTDLLKDQLDTALSIVYIFQASPHDLTGASLRHIWNKLDGARDLVGRKVFAAV
jgi:hypothetical protein